MGFAGTDVMSCDEYIHRRAKLLKVSDVLSMNLINIIGKFFAFQRIVFVIHKRKMLVFF